MTFSSVERKILPTKKRMSSKAIHRSEEKIPNHEKLKYLFDSRPATQKPQKGILQAKMKACYYHRTYACIKLTYFRFT